MKIAPFIFLLIPQFIFSQVTEDFEHNNLIQWVQNEPDRWDTSSVEPVCGTYSLHHIFDNSVSSHDQIILPFHTLLFDSASTIWRFSVRHGYNPSSGNNWGIFLVSDRGVNEIIPGGNISGYVVGVNFSGFDDTLRLWKITDGYSTSISATTVNWQEDIGTGKAADLEIERSVDGLWTIKIDTSGNNNGTVIGTVTDTSYNSTSQFGIYYEYSSGQDRQFWFDNLYINGFFYTDTLPPEVDTFKILPPDKMEILFSEPVLETAAINKIHYRTDNGLNYPDSVWMTDHDKVCLKYNPGFINGNEYYLELSGIPDISGNVIASESIHFLYYVAQQGDVVINEIMADPEPSVLLPEAEYLELYNNTGFDLSLNGWSINVNDKYFSFPETVIKAHDFLTLTKPGNVSILNNYGYIAGIEGFPSLLNSGGSIFLFNELHQLVHSITYSTDWYNTEYKSEGGWSLEMIDPENYCGDKSNWAESNNYKGGTPGEQNSVYASNPDLESPYPVRAALIENSIVRVYFNETMDSISLVKKEMYDVDQNIGMPFEVLPEGPFYKSAILKFAKNFTPGISYTLTVDEISDCSGNSVNIDNHVRFSIAEPADSMDIIINEVLFNPVADGVDFVELYNRSDKTIDLKNFTLCSRDPYTKELKDVCSVTHENFLIFPMDYLLLTTDLHKLEEQYVLKNRINYIQLDDIPSFPDKEGIVTLTNSQLNIIDEFMYSESMHFALLNTTEGVSLERMNSEGQTNDPGNWHSASGDAGYATPGYENSQQKLQAQMLSDFVVEPELFSPDNDGIDDVLLIKYTLADPGNVASITIFDANGRMVKRIARNAVLGTSGMFTWDGLDENHHKASMGIYVVFIEIFDLNGKTRKIKKSCVLAPAKD